MHRSTGYLAAKRVRENIGSCVQLFSERVVGFFLGGGVNSAIK